MNTFFIFSPNSSADVMDHLELRDWVCRSPFLRASRVIQWFVLVDNYMHRLTSQGPESDDLQCSWPWPVTHQSASHMTSY